MRNKDLKARDIMDSSGASEEQNETIIIEDSKISYRAMLENYYNELKEGAIVVPDEDEITEYLNDLIWFSSLEVEGATIH